MPKPAPPPTRRRRGGQPGNLNALKHGTRSRQLEALVTMLTIVPEFRAILQALARRDCAGRIDTFGDALREFQRRSLRNRPTDESPNAAPAESAKEAL